MLSVDLVGVRFVECILSSKLRCKESANENRAKLA